MKTGPSEEPIDAVRSAKAIATQLGCDVELTFGLATEVIDASSNEQKCADWLYSQHIELSLGQ